MTSFINIKGDGWHRPQEVAADCIPRMQKPVASLAGQVSGWWLLATRAKFR
jgi:hypothetical protein